MLNLIYFANLKTKLKFINIVNNFETLPKTVKNGAKLL